MKNCEVVCVCGGIGFPIGANGAPRIISIGRALQAAGIRFRVLHCGPSPAQINTQPSGVYLGIPFTYTTWLTRPENRILRLIVYVRAVASLTLRLWQRRPAHARTIVYLWVMPGLLMLYTSVLCRLLRIPIVLEMNEWYPAFASSRFMRWLYRKPIFMLPTAILVISKEIERRVRETSATVNPSIIVHRISTVIDTDRFVTAPEPHRNSARDIPDFIWCGASYINDVRFMVEALALVNREGYPCRLRIITATFLDWTPESVLAYAAGQGLPSDAVRITVGLDDSALAACYKTAAAHLLPMWQDDKSKTRMPNKLSEYLASGRPVITSGVGELADFLVSGVNAYLGRPGNQRDFADNMIAVLREPETAARIGAAGQATCISRFDFRSQIDNLSQFFTACFEFTKKTDSLGIENSHRGSTSDHAARDRQVRKRSVTAVNQLTGFRRPHTNKKEQSTMFVRSPLIQAESSATIRRVSVVGLGKLGSPIVASFASKGYETIGFDVNTTLVEALANHRAPVNEPGLQDLITAHKARIFATSNWNELVSNSDVSFVIVPTPSNPDGAFSNHFVLQVCDDLGRALRYKNGHHLVVLVSTVMPGSSVNEIVPALERASSKKVGRDFGYCYSPTLIALGSVIRNFLNPDLIMIGAADPDSGNQLRAFYRTVVGDSPEIHCVNPTEAELAKISINTFVTTKISFANMIGLVAEGLGGVGVDRVTEILGSDPRIGKKYLKSGGSYGGPCFPRDNRAFARVAQMAGVEAPIPEAADATNRNLIAHIGRKLESAFEGAPGNVGIVGLAYKLDTDVVEQAMGVQLAALLAGKGFRVIVYDPVAVPGAWRVLGQSVAYAQSLTECFVNSSAIVITNPYAFIGSEIATEMAAGKLIIDCWRVMPASQCEHGGNAAVTAANAGQSAA